MNILNLILLVLVVLSSIIYYPVLPDKMPTHWNFMGWVDQYSDKNFAVWMMPAIVLVMIVLFKFLPKFDPKREKYQLFEKEWKIIQTGLVGFFTYMHFIVIYLSLNPEKKIMPLMFIGMGALFILLGNYLSKIRQNYFIGVKLPWTLASEDNWNKTHRYASWCFVIAGILTLVEAYFVWYAPGVIFSSIMLAAVLPMIYSFLLYKKAENKMKFVYFGLAALIVLMGVARMISREDDWICVNGQWVKHGNPSSQMPTIECQ